MEYLNIEWECDVHLLPFFKIHIRFSKFKIRETLPAPSVASKFSIIWENDPFETPNITFGDVSI